MNIILYIINSGGKKDVLSIMIQLGVARALNE